MKQFRWSVVVFLAVLLWPALAAAQPSYPVRPIRLITPFAPGGSTTTVAHLIGPKLTESWGQPVIVENRPGGNMIIGTDALAKSLPDGHTLLLTTNAHVINPNLFSNLPYDPIKDFAPVATVYSSEFVMVLSPTVPANNLQEWIALAKARPGQLNYATTGTGGSGHLASEMLNMLAGIKTQHIPYKGAGPVLTDLIGGHVQSFINNPITLIPYIRSGKVRGLAVTGAIRLPTLPQVPTFTEAGVSGLEVTPWFALLAPAGTPKTVIEKISAEIARILTMTDIKEKLTSQGMDPFITTPDEFASLMKVDLVKYGKLIKAANIKMEN